MRLGDYTTARVGLGQTGDSLPTQPLLDFRLAHARARDAVHFALDSQGLRQDLMDNGWPAVVLQSRAGTREEYLRRPDLGRMLDSTSSALVASHRGKQAFAVVIADGLSGLAVHRHAAPLLTQALPLLGFEPDDEHPLWIVSQGRVAVGDPIGELLEADVSITLIGERPGLSTPDSLGIYVTWAPCVGRKDSERNCISNIHGDGLSYEIAADKLAFLASEARQRRLTGVALKETALPLLDTFTNPEETLKQ